MSLISNTSPQKLLTSHIIGFIFLLLIRKLTMEALHIWVEEYCLSFDISDDEFDAMSDGDKVLMVGRHIFSEPEMSYEGMCSKLSSIVHLDVEPVSDIGFVEECCFICAVSEQSTQRDDSVKIIMILEPEYQMYLMNIVKDNMPAARDSSAAAEDFGAGAPDEVAMKTIDSGAAAESALAVDAMEDDCVVDDSQLNGGARRSLHNSEANKLLGLNLQKNNEVVDLELKVMEQNAQIAQQQAEISEYQQVSERLTEQLREREEALLRHEGLEDELEILREKAARLEAAELQMEKYRDKLDELSETKQQYKEEVAAHNAHYTSLLAMEAEVETLKKFRTQVDEYRALVAESKIALNELTVRNAEMGDIIAMYKSSESSSSASQHHSVVHTQTLSAQLNAALERIRELETGSDGSACIGSANNECNPVLMQEMELLRSTNAEYRKMLDSTSVEHLEVLQKTNEDLDVMNASLQKKWSFTKDALAHANKEIENYRKTIAQMKVEFATLQREAEEAGLMTEEHNAAELGRKVEIIQDLNANLADTKQCLEVTEAEAEALSVTKNNLERSLKETLDNLGAAKQTMADDAVAHAEEVVGLKRKYKEDIQSQYEEAQSQFVALQEKCDESIRQEINKVNAVTLELEEERIKRRRVERDKKYHENQSHRHKMMANANSGAVGAEGAATSSIAVKEFKRMEQELEAARSEIAELRASGAVCDGVVAGTAAGVGVGSATRLSTRSSSRTGSSSAPSSAISASELDLVDKRCMQLTQEKRELLAKQMQEDQEKLELNQKLIASEKECAALKSKVTRANLEKERLERSLLKLKAAPAAGQENAPLSL
jgi:hypothetical protein